MKYVLLFLFSSFSVFSQTVTKTPVKTSVKVQPIKKATDTKNIPSKTAISNTKDKVYNTKDKVINPKDKNLLLEKKPILNDTIVTITKKSITDAPLEEKNLSYDVAFRLLNSCNTSKLKRFTEFELTSKLLKKITTSYISAICVNNNEEYGKFIGLELGEVLTNENISTNIYRYKIEYERKLQKKEMRIYINKEGLVSVIKTLRWKNKFELKKKYKPKRKRKPKKIIDSLTIIDESFIIRN